MKPGYSGKPGLTEPGSDITHPLLTGQSCVLEQVRADQRLHVLAKRIGNARSRWIDELIWNEFLDVGYVSQWCQSGFRRLVGTAAWQ